MNNQIYYYSPFLIILFLSCKKVDSNYKSINLSSDSDRKYLIYFGKKPFLLLDADTDSSVTITCVNKSNSKNGYFIYNFIKDGSLESIQKFDGIDTLDGLSYYFYPNGIIKSMRNYSLGKLYDYGEDYREENGICKRRIFYDSSGVYFYYVEFSDSSREYSASFNKNNPNSYNLIYRYAAEPYRTSLLDKMNELNLNK